MLDPEEVQASNERLATMLSNHGLGWVVRRAEDAFEEGQRPTGRELEVYGQSDNLALRRLLLLIEAAQRALAMGGGLEREVAELLLAGTRGSRVRIVPDVESGADTRLHPPVVLDRSRAPTESREAARDRIHRRLEQLHIEAVEGR